MSDMEVEEWAKRKWDNTIRNRIKKEDRDKKKNFNRKTFIDWFTGKVKENPICEYCKIPNNKIEGIYWKKRKTKRPPTRIYLEIDREEPEGDYNEDNCVLACFICNNAKSDVFKYKEFVEVGKIIETVWRQIDKPRRPSSFGHYKTCKRNGY